jgi:hypothetical protein
MKITKKIIKYFTEFCNRYPLNFSDKEEKPSLKLFFYNVYRRFRGFAPIYFLRMLFQRIFRWNHIPDCDLWEASGTMAKRLLPVLYAFKKMERNGFPSSYSEYSENSGWKSQDEYNKALENGDIKGGGEEAWENDINHIIHSLEYLAWEGNNKKITRWYIDNFGMDPYSEDIRNKYKYYTYKKGNYHGMTFHNPPEKENITDLQEHETYGNHELLEYIDNYVSSGLEKLGTLWRAFWD